MSLPCAYMCVCLRLNSIHLISLIVHEEGGKKFKKRLLGKIRGVGKENRYKDLWWLSGSTPDAFGICGLEIYGKGVWGKGFGENLKLRKKERQ